MPWGEEGDHSLHWFGLTDGWYWIEAGEHELLRYSDRTISRWAAEEGGGDSGKVIPYPDYYVVRFWEDLLEMVSVLTESVPADLVDFVAGKLPERPDEEISPQAEAALLWHDSHSMNMGPLVNAPNIRLWRTIVDGDDAVTLAWKHPPASDIEFAGPASGRVVVPTESFDVAVSDFDRELFAAMEERVAALEASGPPPDVRLDLEHLRHEQQDRAAWLPRARARQADTDWTAVRAGARELLADTGPDSS